MTPSPGASATPVPSGSPATPSPLPTQRPSPFLIATDADVGSPIAVGTDGEAWLAAFGSREADSAGVFAVRVSLEGEVFDDPPILVSDVERLSASVFNPDAAFYRGPAVTFDGESYWIAFYAQGGFGANGDQFPFGQAIFAANLERSGELAADISLLAQNQSIGTWQPSLFLPVSVAASDGVLIATWSAGPQNPQFCTGGGSPCRLFLGSTVGDLQGPAIGTRVPTSAPAVASWPESPALVAWGELDFADQDALVHRITGVLLRNGEIEAVDFAIMGSATVSATAVSAGDGAFLIAWTSDGLTHEVRGRFYDPDTGPIGPEAGFVIATGDDAMLLGGTTFAGDAHLVVWTEGNVLHGAFVRSPETAGPPMILADDVVSAAVAGNASGFLVAYAQGSDQGGPIGDVVGILVPLDDR